MYQSAMPPYASSSLMSRTACTGSVVSSVWVRKYRLMIGRSAMMSWSISPTTCRPVGGVPLERLREEIVHLLACTLRRSLRVGREREPQVGNVRQIPAGQQQVVVAFLHHCRKTSP